MISIAFKRIALASKDKSGGDDHLSFFNHTDVEGADCMALYATDKILMLYWAKTRPEPGKDGRPVRDAIKATGVAVDTISNFTTFDILPE